MGKRMALLGMIFISFFVFDFSADASATLTLDAKASAFVDVPADSPFSKAIYWAVEHNITNGTSVNTFSPTNICKRKHIIVFLWRACGEPFDDAWTFPFSADRQLSANSVFGKAATWAFWRTPRLEQGEFQYGDPSQLVFEPDRNCSRGEAVIYLWKLAGCPNSDAKNAAQFIDVQVNERSTDAYLRELSLAVAWAVENQITNGTTPDTFSPEMTCNRGQIVTFLYRFSKTTEGKTVISDDA